MEANGDDDELRKNTPLHRRRISLSSIHLLLLISLSTTTRVSASVDESGRRRVIEARSGQDLVWVVQLSDLHFSVHHPERAIDFRNILGPALSLINPSLVLITGDLTGLTYNLSNFFFVSSVVSLQDIAMSEKLVSLSFWFDMFILFGYYQMGRVKTC